MFPSTNPKSRSAPVALVPASPCRGGSIPATVPGSCRRLHHQLWGEPGPGPWVFFTTCNGYWWILYKLQVRFRLMSVISDISCNIRVMTLIRYISYNLSHQEIQAYHWDNLRFVRWSTSAPGPSAVSAQDSGWRFSLPGRKATWTGGSPMEVCINRGTPNSLWRKIHRTGGTPMT